MYLLRSFSITRASIPASTADGVPPPKKAEITSLSAVSSATSISASRASSYSFCIAFVPGPRDKITVGAFPDAERDMHIEFQWFSFLFILLFLRTIERPVPALPQQQAAPTYWSHFYFLIFIQFQHAHKGFLRNLHVSYLAHPLLTFLLLLQQLLLSGNIAAVALGEDVFAHRADGFSGDNL